MKVLFAVSSENISEAIVKKYQKEYKEIISYKNVYYFNAILKELQRDKTYDRVVISEDLEPFTSNNYQQIDKFIFEKLDTISDEASNGIGDTPIILICTDRRSKSDELLVKIFGIGIYDALLGKDRSIDEVCRLINKPRTKKEAKLYYRIEVEEVSYQNESENSVSELEIQNILTHYKRLGRNEERYVESFNNIAAQYNDAQLRIITKFLPLNVKAVLEMESPKYQSIMTFSEPMASKSLEKKNKQEQEEKLKIGFIETNQTKNRLSKPIVVPSAVNTEKVKKLNKIRNNIEKQEIIQEPVIENEEQRKEESEIQVNNLVQDTKIEEPKKRGRGRPRKVETVIPSVDTLLEEPKKRGRGRPRKVVKETNEDNILPGFNEEEITATHQIEEDNILPGFDNENNNVDENILPGFDVEDAQDSILPGFDEEDDKEDENILPGFDDEDDDSYKYKKREIRRQYEKENNSTYTPPSYKANTKLNMEKNESISYQRIDDSKYNNVKSTVENVYKSVNERENNLVEKRFDLDNTINLISKDKKLVSFVGTTKNGTSFLINNIALELSLRGIKTAILDVTKNKNAYYIYTKNEENLRKTAMDCMKKLENGIAEGIDVNKNLTVFTSLPGQNETYNITSILDTLTQEYSVVLIDCDFETDIAYFNNSQEIYLVQSMDILTIQPLTAFLRDLKDKNILKQEKIRIIINKEERVRSLNPKVIIGGMAFYNDPSMSFMTELFNKDNVKYYTIPFDEETYAKYLDGLVNCEISFEGYSKMFLTALRELADGIYPVINSKFKSSPDYSRNNKFSKDMNDTLQQMKNRY